MKIVIWAIVVIVIVGLVVCAIGSMVKDFKENLKSRRIFKTTFQIVLVCTVATYVVALFFKEFDFLEQVGSVDAWIGFAGAGMGGLITMLALYFTLKNSEEANKNNQIVSMKPYVVCHIINLDEENRIKIKDYINDYGFIECKMRNISNNIANGIKIIDEYSSVQMGRNKYEKIGNSLEGFSISIYTVSLNDGTFLAPQEEYSWKTNFCIELNKDGTYKWTDSAFAFKHTIVFQFTDIANLQTYIHKFEFEININVDIYHNLLFFLWNISNSMDINT